MHDDALAPEYVPAVQTAHALWPVAAWVDHPAGQLAHAAALVRPVCAWYLPAAQAVHAAREQPAALCRPAGQSAQVLH